MQKRKSENNPWRAMGIAGAFAADLAICILLGYLGGRWLSNRMDGEKIYVALGALLGLIVGIASVIVLIRYYLKDGQ